MIGLSIDRTSETHSQVNIRIGIHDSINEMGVITRDPELIEGACTTFSKIQDQREDIDGITEKIEKNKKAMTEHQMAIMNDIYNQQIKNQNMQYEKV